jgi:hypothetical protein
MDKEQIMKRLDELGVIHVADVTSEADLETVIQVCEEMDRKNPPELMAFEIKQIEKNRDPVFELDKHYQAIYFEVLKNLVHALWMNEKWDKRKIDKFIKQNFSGKWYKDFVTYENR